MRTAFLLRCTLVAAGCAAAAPPVLAANVCKDAQGRVTIQQAACPVVEPTRAPARPVATLPCTLDEETRRRAARLENQFLTRFPDEAAHRRAEAADLQPVNERIRIGKARRDELTEQRKPLDKEVPFYRDKPMPSWLKNKIDANDAQLAAVDEILKSREQELVGIKARFQCQRDTFGKMWPGAAPGSSACDRPACAPP